MLTLSCANCGAALKINRDQTIIQCEYCGSAQKIEKEGGSYVLATINSKLDELNDSSARTAAELALPRLRAELLEAQNQRYALLAKHQKTAKKQEDSAIGRIIAPPLVGLLSGFFLAYIVDASDGMLMVLIACSLGYGIYRSIKAYKSAVWTVPPPPTLATELDSRIAKIELQIGRLQDLLNRLSPAKN